MIVRETLVFCDGDGCPREGVPLGCGDDRSETARFQLRGNGWKGTKGKHYCPECQKKTERREP